MRAVLAAQRPPQPEQILVNGSAMESNAQRIAYSNAMLQALDVSSVAASAVAAE